MRNQNEKDIPIRKQFFSKLKMLSFGKIFAFLKIVKTSESIPDEYVCQKCKISKPLNKENFQSVKMFKYGFSTYCNECDLESKKVNSDKNKYFSKEKNDD